MCMLFFKLSEASVEKTRRSEEKERRDSAYIRCSLQPAYIFDWADDDEEEEEGK